jgi:hypothetical protein
MDKWKNNAEKLAQKVTAYLKRYSSTYPLYYANTENFESQPNKQNYTGGLYFRNSEDDECCNYNNP